MISLALLLVTTTKSLSPMSVKIAAPSAMAVQLQMTPPSALLVPLTNIWIFLLPV